MPTFCRHNRFIERCPICSRTLAVDEETSATRRGGARTAGSRSAGSGGSARGPRKGGLRVRREGRAADDGYASPLVPGLRASADAERLAAEIAFSSARLAALAIRPPGTYERAVDAAAAGDFDRAAWTAFLVAYLSPSEGEQPFAGIEAVLAAAPSADRLGPELGELLDGIALGPRSSHEPGTGTRTLGAYAQWAQRHGGQTAGFAGEESWPPDRRFARLFERLALPGLGRAARYELLVSLGRLGIFELRADSLHLGAGRTGGAGEDAAALAAKRIFGIGDPLLLDRRAAALAEATGAPLEALDLALFNWSAPERATLGFGPAEEPEADAAAVDASAAAAAAALDV